MSTFMDILRRRANHLFGNLYGSDDNNVPSFQQTPDSSSFGNIFSRTGDQSFDNVQKIIDQFIREKKALGGDPGGAILGQGMSASPSIADQLQNQLNGLKVQTTPYDQLLKQATSQINAQYDPQINQLLRDIGSTKDKATKDEATSRDMYNALAQDAVDQLPDIQSSMQAQQNAINSRYNDAKNNLQQQYDQQSQQQQGVLQQLGIQAASQDANQQRNADQNYFQQQNALSQNQAIDQAVAQGNVDQSYMRDMSHTDRLAGENAAQDIASQLSQYLNNANGQVEDLKGSKANALAALVGQMQQSDAQNAQNNYNNAFNQMMQMNEFQRALTNDQNSNQMDQTKLALQIQQMMNQKNSGDDLFKGTSGMTGLSNFLAKQYPNNPQEASTLSSLVASVLSNPDVQMGRRQDGINTAPITNEYLIQLLRNAATQSGVNNPTDINNAIDALLAYKGQLK